RGSDPAVKLCRVLGPVVSTVKHPAYAGKTLLVVQPVDELGGAKGTSYLAVDTVQAGAGDQVLVLTEGTGVRQICQPADPAHFPVRSVIVGIVDEVTVPGASP